VKPVSSALLDGRRLAADKAGSARFYTFLMTPRKIMARRILKASK
jgi:hypothetical protein